MLEATSMGRKYFFLLRFLRSCFDIPFTLFSFNHIGFRFMFWQIYLNCLFVVIFSFVFNMTLPLLCSEFRSDQNDWFITRQFFKVILILHHQLRYHYRFLNSIQFILFNKWQFVRQHFYTMIYLPVDDESRKQNFLELDAKTNGPTWWSCLLRG